MKRHFNYEGKDFRINDPEINFIENTFTNSRPRYNIKSGEIQTYRETL